MVKVILAFIIGIALAAAYVTYISPSKFEQKKIVAAIQQELTAEPLVIQGAIPGWLEGNFVRNGPIPVSVNAEAIPHWFDGLAMLHGFSFHQGQIHYSNQFLRTDAYKEVFDKGNIYFGGFSSAKKESWLNKLFNLFKFKKSGLSNANVNVAKIATHYVALTEYPLSVRFDLKTLNTLGGLEYQDALPKSGIFESAHPHQDKQKQETLNYLINYGRSSQYLVYKLKQDAPNREVIASVPVERPAYMHSFALTKNKVILVEFPLTVNPIDLLLNKQQGYISNFSWDPKQGTRFIVIDRNTGEHSIIPYSKPFFAFHHVNAFESGDGENIILDIVTYPDAGVISKIAKHGDLTPTAEKEAQAENTIFQQLVRYNLSLKDKKVTEEILLEEPIEFPKINENFNTAPYRYAYLVDPRSIVSEADIRPLYKFDTNTKSSLKWFEPGCMPGEPVFVPNPSGKEEDDGVIVSLVLDKTQEQDQKSFLLMLDAKTFKEIARAYLPFAVPVGLHGQYFN